MLKDMMQRMNSQQTDSQNRVSLLPEGVQMNYSVEEDVLVVNFNSQYSSMSRARELLVRAGVVKTFLQVPGINSVRFTIENEDLKMCIRDKRMYGYSCKDAAGIFAGAGRWYFRNRNRKCASYISEEYESVG